MIAKILGNQVPKGKVKVSGAKNAATRVLAAALISDEAVILENFPTQLVDAKHKINFIRNSGGEIVINEEDETLNISSSNLLDTVLDSYDYPIRTTYLLVPGLLKRNKSARIPYPGGCKIGNRGYDLHIMVWESLGAVVEEKDDYILVHAPNGLKGNKINFPITTIGGTESALICASIAEGETILKNAYISPEVDCLVSFLRTLGVKIEVVGNSYIKIIGTKFLKGSIFRIIPDRIEALTWLIYGTISKGDILIEDVPFDAMEIPLLHVRDTGVDFFQNSKNIRISNDCITNGVIQPFELATGTHPGIISDMQPFYTLLGLHADGISRVFDYRYPERLKYCEELLKFYPEMLTWEKGKIVTTGNQNFIPEGDVTANSTDLRGSMAVVMAALISKKPSIIQNVEMALRGYNKLQEKLTGLGVEIEIID